MCISIGSGEIFSFINSGGNKTEGQECTGRKDKDQCGLECGGGDTETEPCAGTENFTYGCDQNQCGGEAESHRKTVNRGRKNGVLGCVRFCTGKNDAVDDDQRDIKTQCVIERREERFHQKLDRGDKAGNDDDIGSDTDFLGDKLAEQGNKDIGTDENCGCRKSHADGVGNGGRCCQRRTHAEELHKNGILIDNAVFDLFYILIHCRPPLFLWD